MKLTPSIAKQIALDMSPEIHPIDQREFFLIHTENVVKIGRIIAKKLNLDEDFFEIAGRIHDIGYAKDFEHHAEYTIPMLMDLWYEIDKTLEDCILNHGSQKSPTTLEGKIFQIADKLSVFDAQTIELFIKYEEFPMKKDGLAFLKNMSERACKLLEDFEE